MTVCVSYKTIEDNYGTILAIFIIFQLLFKLIRLLRKFTFKFLKVSLLYTVNFKTCSQPKTSGTKLLEVHGIKKELDPNLRPEKQHAIPKQGRSEKPWVGQGRAGLRRRRLDHINQPSDVTQGIPGGSKIETGKTKSSQGKNNMCDRAINNNNPFLPDIPLHPDLLHKHSSLH